MLLRPCLRPLLTLIQFQNTLNLVDQERNSLSRLELERKLKVAHQTSADLDNAGSVVGSLNESFEDEKVKEAEDFRTVEASEEKKAKKQRRQKRRKQAREAKSVSEGNEKSPSKKQKRQPKGA